MDITYIYITTQIITLGDNRKRDRDTKMPLPNSVISGEYSNDDEEDGEINEIAHACIQPSVFEVINDITKGVVARETFWVWFRSSPNEDEATVYEDINAYKQMDELVLEPVGRSGISVARESRFGLNVRYNGNTYPIKFPRRVFSRYASNNKDLTSVDLSPGGELLVVGNSSGGVDVISAVDGDTRRNLDGHLIHTSTVKFFPSGEVVVSTGMDFQIKVWSVVDGSNPRTLKGHKGTINDIALVGRGRNILSASNDGTVRLWELGSGEDIYTFQLKEHRGDIKSIILLDCDTTSENGAFSSPVDEYETEGKILISGDDAGNIALWDLYSKKLIQHHKMPFGVTHLCAISDDQFAYGLEDGQVGIFDNIKAPEPSYIVRKSYSEITCLASFNGFLAIGSDDNTPFLIDLNNDKKPIFLGGFEDPVSGVVFRNNSVIFVGKTGFIRSFDLLE